MAEDDVSEADLSGRLATVLEEIRDVMEKRKQRIEELRQEITQIENDNDVAVGAALAQDVYTLMSASLLVETASPNR